MKSYNYTHRTGVRRITWNQFASLARHLAELVEPFQPQVILGIARAGLFPATVVACSLRRELFPIRLTRRKDDEVLYDLPVWKVPVPQEVDGKVVVVIDEIADTGLTLSMAAQNAKVLGAKEIVTACLVSHSWAKPAPQVSALVSDAFVIFPWDKQVLENGKWIAHPEVIAGLNAKVFRSKNSGN
jgi:hypoxanthine phosphoribosyltransferase